MNRKPLRKTCDVHEAADWQQLRHLRYVRHEAIEGGNVRVELFDDEELAVVYVYCRAELVPDPTFWRKQIH